MPLSALRLMTIQRRHSTNYTSWRQKCAITCRFDSTVHNAPRPIILTAPAPLNGQNLLSRQQNLYPAVPRKASPDICLEQSSQVPQRPPKMTQTTMTTLCREAIPRYLPALISTLGHRIPLSSTLTANRSTALTPKNKAE